MVIGFDASRAFVSEPTGTENYSYQLLKALSRIDHKNKYIVYVRNLSLATCHLSPNFKFKEIRWSRLWTQGGLALECLVNPPDVLFIPAHTLPVIRRPNLKTVVTIHDLGVEYLPQYHQFPQKYYLNWSTIYAVKNAVRIIAVSQNTRKDLITKLQCDTQVIRVIYEGVQPLHLKTKGVLEKYKVTKPFILFVGTIQPRKNLVRLIEAFATIARGPAPTFPPASARPPHSARLRAVGSPSSRVTPRALSLVLVGKPGWLYEEIYAAPKRLGLSDKVKFLNFVPDDDLAILYKEASVFCLPSLYEGFGLPVLEAMAAGVPVVVSKTSSLPEVVGDAGVLVDPYNVNDITEGLKKVLENQSLRQTLIKKGRERAKKFNWEKTARETLKVLEEAYKTKLKVKS